MRMEDGGDGRSRGTIRELKWRIEKDDHSWTERSKIRVWLNTRRTKCTSGGQPCQRVRMGRGGQSGVTKNTGDTQNMSKTDSRQLASGELASFQPKVF